MSKILFNSVDYVSNSYSRISGNSILNLDNIYVLQNDVGGFIDAYSKSEIDALLVPINNKINDNHNYIVNIKATSTTLFNENINQNITITTNLNNIASHELTKFNYYYC